MIANLNTVVRPPNGYLIVFADQITGYCLIGRAASVTACARAVPQSSTREGHVIADVTSHQYIDTTNLSLYHVCWLPGRVHSHMFTQPVDGYDRLLAGVLSTLSPTRLEVAPVRVVANNALRLPVTTSASASRMPYIMVMGSLSSQHLSKDEGATVYGLKSEERATLVRELNSTFAMNIATASDPERVVRVTQKGLTLVVVNRLHAIFGYDVVSHAMAMTNANRELVSFTLYKKSSPSSHGHGHSHSHSHSSHKSHTHSSHGGGSTHTHGNVVTL